VDPVNPTEGLPFPSVAPPGAARGSLAGMGPLAVGTNAPPVPGVAFGDDPTGLFFYKVTCPTCQMAAPTMAVFEDAFPGRVVGIGQDPVSELDRFSHEFEIGISSIEDAPPYPISDAYGIVSVPTLFLVGAQGRILDVVGAWDRSGFNGVAATLAELIGAAPVTISTPDDGRPAFKPG
jgi:hypothetical protein